MCDVVSFAVRIRPDFELDVFGIAGFNHLAEGQQRCLRTTLMQKMQAALCDANLTSTLPASNLELTLMVIAELDTLQTCESRLTSLSHATAILVLNG